MTTYVLKEEDMAAIRVGIQTLCRVAHEMCVSKGWYEEPATVGDRIALCHSELSEALEEYRAAKSDYEAGLTAVRFEHSAETPGHHKPEGFPVELADVLIRLADMSGAWDIDLAGACVTKLLYNNARPYRHGGKKI